MLVIAAVNWPVLVTLAIGVFGLAGVIFTALKFNRDDTTAIVSQQNTLMGDMKMLNDELRTSTEVLRGERDSLRDEVARLNHQLEDLRASSGRIEQKLDEQ
ncbi:MAG TPA: hypothetical protein VNS88_06140 [Nitrospiraceae bacterium]|nr:hypothetical protein [Nitrospiraceae bacterium]